MKERELNICIKALVRQIIALEGEKAIIELENERLRKELEKK